MVGLVLAAALGDNDALARKKRGKRLLRIFGNAAVILARTRVSPESKRRLLWGNRRPWIANRPTPAATEISPADWMIFFFMSAKLQQIIWLIKKKSVLLHRILMESL